MAAGATYEPIATTTLASAASSITFSSIPSTYTDLKLVLVAKSANNPNVWVLFNSDSGANYSQTMLKGDGTSASSTRETSQTKWWLYPAIQSIPFFFNIDIFSYAGSTNKTFLLASSGDANGSGEVYRNVGLWRNTAAINSISLNITTWQFSAGTTATLYGIKAA